MRICLLLAALGATVALAGCNETNGAMAGPVVAAPSPVALSLPPGAPCSNEIGHYQTIVKGDLATGNLEQSVYDKIQIDMAHAASACAAGNAGKAHSIIANSKANNGYRG